jgi:STE24 endopeptidase
MMLPLPYVILIVLGFLAVNLLYAVFTARHVRRYFAATGSVEKAVHRMDQLSRAPQLILVFLTILGTSYFIIPHLGDGFFGRVLGITQPILLLLLLLIGHQMVLYPVQKEIRQTEDTRMEQIGGLFRLVLLLYTPMVLYFGFLSFAPQNFVDSLLDSPMGRTAIPFFFGMIVLLLQPMFIGRTLKAKTLEEGEMKARFLEFAKKAGVTNVHFYIYPSKKERVANVLVAGYLKKRIYIADYLLDHCTEEEIVSIIGHEFGHIKRYHLWIKVALMMLWYPLIQTVAYIGDVYAPNAPEWVIITTLTAVAVLYFGVFYLFISRIQEKEADAYVLKLGIPAHLFISALYKLTKLNDALMQKGRLDETFRTHPSTARRINWVAKQAGLSVDEAARVCQTAGL